MTKKHFEALAAELKRSKPHPELKDRMLQWEQSIAAVEYVCARFNPNFDRARFLAACGVEG